MPDYTGSRTLLGIAAVAMSCLVACAQTGERKRYAPAPAEAATVPQQGPVGTPMAAAEAPEARSREAVRVREDAPLRYVVQRGDTLWDLSKRFLLEPWQWPEIWYVNDQIANPHLIYPGDVLTLIWRDGRPMVLREDLREDLNLERLSPRVRELPLEAAIPTIPIEAIRDFLRRVRVVTAEDLRRAPYVLGFADPRLVVGAGSEVYVRNLPVAERYQYDAVRIGNRYVDPDSGEFLGWEAIPVADMQVRRYGEPATAMVARSYREMRAGDRLLEPEPEDFSTHFYPRPAAADLVARIISVFDGVSQIGQYQVVTLSRGADDGLEVGHVLDVFQSGRRTRDPYSGVHTPLPEVFAGRVMVFKRQARVSFALVVDAEREIHLFDRVRGPQPAGG
ncbi:LysM peptidoglycan-binding domain-containing protein [Sinimarinibacterium thermocellulolyticum]|uniref:LysM domain-containing protein n=1 Tax=Sinimarinibacterium thermocellulolyticum TaxID=3170016 RepID=A0ABV2A731_9GAMM